MMKHLDARGLSCPEPVIMIRKAMMGKAMMGKEDRYEMVVDNPTSKENVTRYAQHQGYQVAVIEQGGEYTLVMTK